MFSYIYAKGHYQATLGLTLFVAGYGLGPMLWAPMSEIPQIGRNPVYIGTLFVFVALQIPVALATNFGMLLCFRFLTGKPTRKYISARPCCLLIPISAGFIGSPVLATGGASISDMYTPRKRAYGIATWGINTSTVLLPHKANILSLVLRYSCRLWSCPRSFSRRFCRSECAMELDYLVCSTIAVTATRVANR